MKPFRLSLVLGAVMLMLSATTHAAELLGAGATFPYPYYAKLFSDYNKKTGVQVNYQSIGSGGGVQQLKSKTVNFGASDAFLTDAELKTMPGKVIHIPTCLGAVVLAYNLPGVTTLKLDASVIADIFLGKLTKWNDPRLKALNPGVALPDLKIVSVHRSDGSGTTAIFTDYLSKISSTWGSRVGDGKSVNWPNGLGAKGNAGVAGMVKQMPGSIGYIELNYAAKNKISFAIIKNKSGKYIEADMDSISAAADVKIPDDTRVSITDTEADAGYPISGFTWLLVYSDLSKSVPSEAAAKSLVDLLKYVISDGQAFAKSLDYAPLPKSVIKKSEKLISVLTYQGRGIR